MKKSTIVLFMLGVLLQGLGVMVAFPDRFPLVSACLSRDFNRASVAVKRLERRQEVTPEVTGFDQIAGLYVDRIKEINAPRPVKGLQVMKFSPSPKTIASIGIGGAGARERVPIEIYLSNGEQGSWDLIVLRERVQALKQRGAFWATLCLVLVGCCLEFTGIWWESRKSKPESAQQSPPAYSSKAADGPTGNAEE